VSSDASLFERLYAALPQTQCTRCGYPDCRAYAQAMADGLAPINQCPPGGEQGIARLAELTGQPALALNTEHGQEEPRGVAIIDEAWCIGCTLCLPACPVDAIVGANKRMHTVMQAHCTGCALCLPVCPVDCIHMEPVTSLTGWQAWSVEQARAASARYEVHQLRQVKAETRQAQRLEDKARAKLADLPAHTQLQDPAEIEKKRMLIEAALARAQARKQAAPPP
jgi:electron transport complex protein RnfB